MLVLPDRKRLGVDPGVDDGVLDLQVPEIQPPKAFDHMEGVAVNAADDTSAIVEADRIDDQGVALPFADGVTPERGIGINGKWTAVHEDLAERGFKLVQDDDHACV